MHRAFRTQDMVVPDAAGVADAIEELEDPDRHLTATAAISEDDIAKRGGTSGTLLLVELLHDSGQLRDRAGGEVVIVRDRVELTGTGDTLEQLPYGWLGRA